MNAAFLHRAELFLERKEWKNLIELAQGALSDSSNNTMAKYYLALGLLHTEKLEEAERCIDQCLSSMPTFPGFLFAKARIHLKKAEPASAQNIANYLLSKNPDNVDALLLMAKTHLKLMEIGKAWPYLNRALEIAPDNTEVHNCFVLAQTLSGETVSTAYVDYQLKSNPKNAQALIQKIDLLLDQQSYAEARDLALNTVSQHPANHEVITTAQNALLHHVYFHRAGLALWNWLYFDMKYFYPISFIILTVVFLFGFAGDYSDKGTFFHWLFLVMSIVCSPLVVLVFRKPIAFAHLYVWPSTKRFLFEDQKWAGFCILSLFVLSLGTGLTFLMNFSPERGLYLSAFFAFLTIPVYEYSNSITLNDPYPKARLAYLAVAAIGILAVIKLSPFLLTGFIVLCSIAFFLKAFLAAAMVIDYKLKSNQKNLQLPEEGMMKNARNLGCYFLDKEALYLSNAEFNSLDNLKSWIARDQLNYDRLKIPIDRIYKVSLRPRLLNDLVIVHFQNRWGLPVFTTLKFNRKQEAHSARVLFNKLGADMGVPAKKVRAGLYRPFTFSFALILIVSVYYRVEILSRASASDIQYFTVSYYIITAIVLLYPILIWVLSPGAEAYQRKRN